MQGSARPVRELPTIQHPEGKVIIHPSGFWTNVQTTGGARTIHNSKGDKYIFPSSGQTQ
jgi:hypothetical protein